MKNSHNRLRNKTKLRNSAFSIYAVMLSGALAFGGCTASSNQPFRRHAATPKGSVVLAQGINPNSAWRKITLSKNSYAAPGTVAFAAAPTRPSRTQESTPSPLSDPSSRSDAVAQNEPVNRKPEPPVTPVEPAPAVSPAEPPSNNQQVPASQAQTDPDSVQVPAEIEERKLYSFRAENLDVKSALAVFARANNLNIVPDEDVTGTVTLDIQDLPLERVLQALLEAHDFSWTDEDGLIRVRATDTRMFTVDYLRMSRTGVGASSATLSSGSNSGSGGGAGRGGGGFGGGGGMAGGAGGGLGGGAGGGSGGLGSAGTISGSAVNLTQENPVDFWTELEAELAHLLTERGRESLAVNKTAGMIQITDRPSALRRVDRYLANLGSTVQRQVEIEAKLYDVTLNNQFQFGLDWDHIIKMYGGQLRLIGSPTVISPGGATQLKENALTMVFNNDNTSVVLTALKEQGEVSVISQPRLRTLNNQTALIKVGTDTPFFSQDVFFLPSTVVGGAATLVEEVEYQLITIGTPQISADDSVTLDISPVITSLVDTRIGPNNTTAPVIDIKQASSIVRVNNGETIVLGGLIQDSSARTVRKIPVIGDIPVLGKLFQGKFESNQKKELVIFLTPRIVR